MISFTLRMPLVVVFLLAAVFVVGCHRPATSPMSSYITLRVIYQDNETQTGETVVNGQRGANTEFHSGTATYVFKKQSSRSIEADVSACWLCRWRIGATDTASKRCQEHACLLPKAADHNVAADGAEVV